MSQREREAMLARIDRECKGFGRVRQLLKERRFVIASGDLAALKRLDARLDDVLRHWNMGLHSDLTVTVGRDEYLVPQRGVIRTRTAGSDGPFRDTDTSFDGGWLSTPKGGSPLRREVSDAIIEAWREVDS